MRTTWKGAITIGMVVVPVKMYKATGDGDGVSFRQLCPDHMLPIQYRKFCTGGGEEVTEKPVRGYEVDKTTFVPITDEDLENLPVPSARQIRVLEFVDPAKVSDLYHDGSYFLEPEDIGAMPYAVIRTALRETGKVALGMIATSSREQFCRISVEGETLLLTNLHFPAEVRSSAGLKVNAGAEVDGAMKAMAVALVHSLTSQEFEPEKYTNEFGLAVRAVVDARLAGETAPAAPTAPKPSSSADLMAALQATIDSRAAAA
jgi:DNA end-binding protein Ku